MPSKQFVRAYFKAFTQDPVQKCFTSESSSKTQSKTVATTDIQTEEENQPEINSYIAEDQSQEISENKETEVNHIPPSEWYFTYSIYPAYWDT